MVLVSLRAGLTINRLGLCAGSSCNPSQTLAGNPNPNPNPRTRFVMVRVFKAHHKRWPVCTLSPCQNRVMAASDAAKTKRNRFAVSVLL